MKSSTENASTVIGGSGGGPRPRITVLIILLAILIGVVYTIYLLKQQQKLQPAEYFRVLPYTQGADTTVYGGTGGNKKPLMIADTLILYHSSSDSAIINNSLPCDCAPKYMIMYALTTSDSTTNTKKP